MYHRVPQEDLNLTMDLQVFNLFPSLLKSIRLILSLCQQEIVLNDLPQENHLKGLAQKIVHEIRWRIQIQSPVPFK